MLFKLFRRDWYFVFHYIYLRFRLIDIKCPLASETKAGIFLA